MTVRGGQVVVYTDTLPYMAHLTMITPNIYAFTRGGGGILAFKCWGEHGLSCGTYLYLCLCLFMYGSNHNYFSRSEILPMQGYGDQNQEY